MRMIYLLHKSEEIHRIVDQTVSQNPDMKEKLCLIFACNLISALKNAFYFSCLLLYRSGSVRETLYPHTHAHPKQTLQSQHCLSTCLLLSQ